MLRGGGEPPPGDWSRRGARAPLRARLLPSVVCARGCTEPEWVRAQPERAPRGAREPPSLVNEQGLGGLHVRERYGTAEM